MSGTASVNWALDEVSLPLDILNVRCFIAPVLTELKPKLTCFFREFFTKEAINKPWAGLFEALFVSNFDTIVSYYVVLSASCFFLSTDFDIFWCITPSNLVEGMAKQTLLEFRVAS